jgi:hypothetical protein
MLRGSGGVEDVPSHSPSFYTKQLFSRRDVSNSDAHPCANKTRMSTSGPLLPIQHVRCEVGSLSETGPIVLGTRLSHLDPKQL